MIKSEKFNELRKQAEDLLPSHSNEIPKMSVENVQKLMHELEIHQAELEIQNQELYLSRMELEISHNEYSEIFDFAPVGYFILDMNELICKVNLAGADMLGIERRYLIQRGFSHFVVPEFRSAYYTYQNNILETENRESIELKLLKKDGTSFYALVKSIALKDVKGVLNRLQIAVTDIDEQKKTEMLLKEALTEKEVLLREIHHRVKNNIQTLSYLIDMQKDNVNNQEVINALDEFQGRAKSMGMVHAMLYQSENLAQLDFRKYIRELADAQYYAMAYKRPISFVTKSIHVKMTIRTAIPCGLIINELLTNTLKYAFPDDKPGHGSVESGCKIQITFDKEDDMYIMSVSDNGVGFPPEFDWQKNETLGMKLVNIWSGYQLGGSIETDFTNGTKFIIRFPV